MGEGNGVHPIEREKEREYPRGGLRGLVVAFSGASQGVMRLCSIRQISIFARASASVWAYVELGFPSSSALEALGARDQWQIHFLSGSSSAVWPLGYPAGKRSPSSATVKAA